MPKADVLIDRNFLKPLYFDVRCPGCHKLYRIDSRDLPASTSADWSKGYFSERLNPDFDCQVCATSFTVSFEPVGLPGKGRSSEKFHHFHEDRKLVAKPVQFGQDAQITNLKLKKADLDRIKSCPKCNKLNPLLVSECQSCGVLFEKIENHSSAVLSHQATPSVVREWKAVLANPNDSRAHEQFLQECENQGTYDFALEQYSKLSEIKSVKDLVPFTSQLYQRLRRRVTWLAVFESRVETLLNWPHWPRILVAIPLAFAIISIFVGFYEPGLRNLVGIGASIGFLWAACFILSQVRN